MATTYLESDFAGTGSSSAAIATYSFWLKLGLEDTRATLISGKDDTSNYMKVRFADDGSGHYFAVYGISPACDLRSTRLFQDPTAWYHVVMAFDTAQAVDTNRIKVWINGEQITSWSTSTFIAQNEELFLTKSNDFQIGAYNNTEHFDGLMSHFHCIDGTAYDATAFGETDATSGIWKIKTSPSVTYGTKGYFILKDGAGLTDQSGNSNNFTLGAGTLTATKDNPSNNFITLNPLGENAIYTSGTHDLLNGNTTFDPTNTSYFSWSAGSLGVSASKWYWEVKFSGTPGGDWPDIGFIKTEDISTRQSESSPSQHGTTYISVYEPNGTKWIFNTQTTSWGSGYVSGDIIMCAVDCDNGKLWWGKNGTWEASGSVGDPAAGTNPAGTFTAGTLISPIVQAYEAGSVYLYHNFGNGYFGTTAVASTNADDAGIGSFEYDVPAGFYALCTKNIKAYGG